jgi:hypothetical protein
MHLRVLLSNAQQLLQRLANALKQRPQACIVAPALLC